MGSKGRLDVICGLSRYLDKGDLGLIMKAYVIHYNMVVEYKSDSYYLAYDYEHADGATPKTNF